MECQIYNEKVKLPGILISTLHFCLTVHDNSFLSAEELKMLVLVMPAGSFDTIGITTVHELGPFT